MKTFDKFSNFLNFLSEQLLDACSIIQLNKSPKMESVDLDVAFKVGDTFCHPSDFFRLKKSLG